MRIAIVSDIHGNLTAFEAVLRDLQITAPDLIFHGGDLAGPGARPAEVIDLIRGLGWQGVLGNTDEMLTRPASLTEFAGQSSAPPGLFAVIEEMADATRAALDEARFSWLRTLPMTQIHGSMALVHASPGDCWRSPGPEADDATLQSVYSPLGKQVAVYSHIHRPYIRNIPGMTVANTGSVSLPYDGDPRAAYLLLDDSVPAIRRVEYDIDKEAQALACSGLPHYGWTAAMLKTGRFQMP